MLPRSAALAALFLTLFVTACGGGGDKGSADRGYTTARGYGDAKAALVASSDFAAQTGLGGEPSALTASYKPTGKIVADNGFRPYSDGFAFPNYSNDAQPKNLGTKELQDLFGDAVCIGGTSGADCELTPAATTWAENQNNGMAGGHCEGFSMTALRFFTQNLNLGDYGGAKTADLPIEGNDPLQGEIAEGFMYQALPSVLTNQVHGTPTDILNELKRTLPSNQELYTLGIYMPDRTGGHAITPFAIEDKGGGQYSILVYDNNYPGATRAVAVDTNADTWSYEASTNPDQQSALYQGDATTNTLELDPLSPGLGTQPCPFCQGEAKGDVNAKGSVFKAKEYTEIAMQGDPLNHPHLVFQDDKGRKTGVIGGKLVSEIPDIQVVSRRLGVGVNTWAQAPEPTYRLPEGKGYIITIDGSDLTKAARPTVNLIGNGLVLEVEDITIAPGQKDRMQVLDGYGIAYESNSDSGEAPNIFAGVVKKDAAYIFAASAVGIEKGSAIRLIVVPEENVVLLDSSLARGVNGQKGHYILNLSKQSGDGKIGTWTKDVRLAGEKGESVGFEYSETAKIGKPLPLVYVGADGNPTGKTLLLQPDKA
ncbi:MAG: hypothetical protein JWM73_1504 [Solirubrobacterales bacterium]|nr:hypothetical protein [Solirubrobacterales bacterium]